MIAEKSPAEIIGGNAETIKMVLKGWRVVQGKMDWKDFTAKSGPQTKEMMAAVFGELRRNGYFNPRVRDGEIVVDYACYRRGDIQSRPHDLCTLCERTCERQEEISTGTVKWKKGRDKNYQEQRPCWERGRV